MDVSVIGAEIDITIVSHILQDFTVTGDLIVDSDFHVVKAAARDIHIKLTCRTQICGDGDGVEYESRSSLRQIDMDGAVATICALIYNIIQTCSVKHVLIIVCIRQLHRSNRDIDGRIVRSVHREVQVVSGGAVTECAVSGVVARLIIGLTVHCPVKCAAGHHVGVDDHSIAMTQMQGGDQAVAT